MTRRGLLAACAGLAGIGLAAIALPVMPAQGEGAAILGARPGYGPAAVSTPPNQGAITRRIWTPGLDDGHNAQGLAVAGGSIFISAYRSDSPVNRVRTNTIGIATIMRNAVVSRLRSRSGKSTVNVTG